MKMCCHSSLGHGIQCHGIHFQEAGTSQDLEVPGKTLGRVSRQSGIRHYAELRLSILLILECKPSLGFWGTAEVCKAPG